MQTAGVFLAACILFSGAHDTADRIPVRTLDELPRHAYPVAGTVSELIRSDESFRRFASAFRRDLEADLQAYKIEDASTLRQMYINLLTLDIMERRHASVRARVEMIRDLEDKEAKRLTTGLTALAVVRAREETGEDGGERFLAAFADHLRDQLADLPWDVIRTRIVSRKGHLEIMTRNLLLGIVQAQFDPVASAKGEISSELAGQVVNIGYALKHALPLKQPMLEVYGEFIDWRGGAGRDIWTDRALTLSADAGLSEVLVAVWDSGVDMSLFEGRRFVNAAESFDGRDDDGNGFVDDVHGIAYDYQGRRDPSLLRPIGDAAPRVYRALDRVKGSLDLRASVDSPEAAELKSYLDGLDPTAVKGFIEDMSLCAQHVHGTHVADIAARGNPYARILGARITFDHHVLPELFTAEMARRHADAYRETVAYFREHGVRVANMSWGWGLREIESILEANGRGEDPRDRAREAMGILEILEGGLQGAIAGAPEILFVAAAGNEDNDPEFDAFVPASLDLPNLLVVGAVDRVGRATSFTSTGRTVRVYANGFEVVGRVPGGRELKLSGTSMAAPNVSNLAAKLLVLDPDLTPREVVGLIEAGADDVGAYRLIHPRRTAKLLRR